MDAIDISKTLNAKIGGVLERLMNELSPEIRSVLVQTQEMQAIPEDQRAGACEIVAGKTIATMVIASTLAQLRGHGCPEEVLEAVVTEAVEYERNNAQAAAS